ncbi:MmgE/PrpD family protein [Silicimonas algicola]|uniref:2-methylcitrate dehydratase PrpD n=1 Tax=Silicimonas algicola TaxID=1826607 RepID=A0A316G1A0_9RHOB|nr:MmgE/PrpD family protein [Silicimonas algicola]AZQ68276.1 MmgE/PrpD family protein [Silicimonas algicola]PWK54588.1 2-methylcitrate dehydratase PrpD [Silicimonas algicola]
MADGRSAALAAWISGAADRPLPDEVRAAAREALIDHIGVAVGAANEGVTLVARRMAQRWAMPGRARIYTGGLTGAPLAALVNGTMAHATDFDDTHENGSGHISAPVLSAALALALDQGQEGDRAVAGFVAGFEVMARLGGGFIDGVGRNLQARGFHPTGIHGVVGAAAAASVLRGFDAAATASALGAAATTASGLVASFGTHAKPFHAGHAAMNGLMAADLAADGFAAATDLLDLDRGLLPAMIQDGKVTVPPLDLDRWLILRNGYKPFACCRATHASAQAGHRIGPRLAGRRITRVTTRVHRSAPFTAGRMDPQTPLEAKFSVAFCLSAAICGYQLEDTDFAEPMLRDTRVRAILPVVELHPQPDQPQSQARIDVWLEDGTQLTEETTLFLGHPDNPMGRDRIAGKFLSLVTPVLGEGRTTRLLAALDRFESPGALGEMADLLAGRAA